jgi:hypothetical protein
MKFGTKVMMGGGGEGEGTSMVSLQFVMPLSTWDKQRKEFYVAGQVTVSASP